MKEMIWEKDKEELFEIPLAPALSPGGGEGFRVWVRERLLNPINFKYKFPLPLRGGGKGEG